MLARTISPRKFSNRFVAVKAASVFLVCLACCSEFIVTPLHAQQRVLSVQKVPLQKPQVVVTPDDAIKAAAAKAAAAATPVAANPDAPDPEQVKREAKKKTVLKALDKVVLNRLPSKILQTWSDTKQPVEETEEVKDGLPPAPKEAILYDAERFAKKLKTVQQHFALGNWDELKSFMDMLPEANAKTFHGKIVAAMSAASAKKLPSNNFGGNKADQRAYQKPFMTFDDAIAIAKLSPTTIEKKGIAKYSGLFNETIGQGNTVQDLLAILRKESAKAEEELVEFEAAEKAKKSAKENDTDDGNDTNGVTKQVAKKETRKPIKPFFTKRNCALLLISAGKPIESGEFLPELETAKTENDHEALNLLSVHYLSLYARDEETAMLEKAWHVTQAILASEKVDKEERKQALTRTVQLTTKVRDELGQKWLDDTFSQDSSHGIELVASVGSDVATSMIKNPKQPELRLKQLELQTNVVNQLLKRANKDGEGLDDNWQQSLELMAANWLREADAAYHLGDSSSLRPSMRRDSYGNMYYYDDYYSRQRQQMQRLTAINISDLLENKPSEEWMEYVNPTLRPRFDMILAQLYLKVQEEDLAFPYLERLAKPYPKQTEALVEEFLRVWTTNHDPNAGSRRTNSYMYMYGYESRAESIPLTRSKQQRNLEELSELIPKLQKLQEKKLDQELIASAFYACHSTAEVYKIEELEKVFGSFDGMDPEVVMSLAQRMRANLAKLWRDATVQKKQKTKRTKIEIQEEVLRGYTVAQQVIQRAVEANPEAWTLMVANASLKHDELDYRADLSKSAEYSANRKAALEMFKTAAETYVAGIDKLEEKDYSVDAFTTWFYAGMGACDLGLIDERKINAPKEPGKIKMVLDTLPEKARDWHIGRFANLLFNRMSAAKAHIKHRYLKGGFEITGDHEQAAEAKQVFDYYLDLVSEIKLVTEIDGDDRVGTDQPFGVFVNLKHTKEIERESGGFGRYLQNQNQGRSYNYGRPTNDYRDKFEEHVRQTFTEQFEILSVTFHKPEVKSVPDAKAGWRITPYAYLLLKSKAPSVDKIPPVKLDLDFLDTSGYAILPIESPALPIECGEFTDRPVEEVRLTQILDERQSEDGKLILEVKATGQGLMPAMDKVVDVDDSKFEVTEVEDQGVNVSRFDDEADGNVVVSERSWMVHLAAKSGQTELPKNFAFPKPAENVVENVYQRYVDADLETVEAEIALEEKYGEVSYAKQIYAALGIAGLFLVGFALFWMLSRPKPNDRRKQMELAENASPFAVISMLQNLHRNNGLSSRQKTDLGKSINRLEDYYFGGQSNGRRGREPDLKAVVRKWSRVRKS